MEPCGITSDKEGLKSNDVQFRCLSRGWAGRVTLGAQNCRPYRRLVLDCKKKKCSGKEQDCTTRPQIPTSLLNAQIYTILRFFNLPERLRKWSQVDRIAVGANGFHRLTPTHGIHLRHDSMDVVSHRKLREIQLRSDLLVCQTFGDEGDQSLLPQSKIRSCGRATVPSRVSLSAIGLTDAHLKNFAMICTPDGLRLA